MDSEVADIIIITAFVSHIQATVSWHQTAWRTCIVVCIPNNDSSQQRIVSISVFVDHID